MDDDVSCRPANLESDGNDIEGRKCDDMEVGCWRRDNLSGQYA